MIVENEYGKTLIIPAGLDISANTGLTLDITRYDGSVVNIVAGITAPAVDVVVDGVTYSANNYASYVLLDGDITEAGEYKAKLVATFANKQLRSALTRFSVSR